MHHQTPQKLSGGMRALLWLSAAVVGLVVLALVLMSVQREKAETALAETIAGLEAAGFPTTGRELNRRYHEHGHDPAGNASSIYDRAFAAAVSEGLPMSELSEALWATSDRLPLSPERVNAIREIVEANGESIRLLKQAAEYPCFRRNLDVTEGGALVFTRQEHFREAAQLLAGEALIAAVENNADPAIASIAAIFRIGVHLSEEPSMVSQLIRIEMEEMGQAVLEQVLNRIEVSPDLLGSLREQLRLREESASGIQFALQGELATTLWYFDLITSARSTSFDGKATIWEEIGFFFYLASGRFLEDQRQYLLHLERLLNLMRLPHSERHQVDWEADIRDLRIFETGGVFGSFSIPPLGRALEADTRVVTGLRAARIGLAAEQYRIKRGSFPLALEELVPDYLEKLPEDPYSADGTFEWIRETDGFSVRSQGMITVSRDAGEVPIEFRLPANGRAAGISLRSEKKSSENSFK